MFIFFFIRLFYPQGIYCPRILAVQWPPRIFSKSSRSQEDIVVTEWSRAYCDTRTTEPGRPSSLSRARSYNREVHEAMHSERVRKRGKEKGSAVIKSFARRVHAPPSPRATDICPVSFAAGQSLATSRHGPIVDANDRATLVESRENRKTANRRGKKERKKKEAARSQPVRFYSHSMG